LYGFYGLSLPNRKVCADALKAAARLRASNNRKSAVVLQRPFFGANEKKNKGPGMVEKYLIESATLHAR
jgi:hypothetical protein